MISVGDIVTWQKREPGKLHVGLSDLRVEQIGQTKGGTKCAVLSHYALPDERIVAPLADLHKD